MTQPLEPDPYRDRRLFGEDLSIDPYKTAVIVIDMLNDFCVHPGKLADESALSLCSAQNMVLASARDTGAVVVFVNEEHRPIGLRAAQYGDCGAFG